jgi:hypothetical protein
MTSRGFDALGFSPGYACEVDPEFPGTGDWGDPHHGFQRDGRATGPFRSRWGVPLVVRFTPVATGRWVGSFEAGGTRELTGVFACPAPTAALVVCGGQPYLVDVAEPTRSAPLSLPPVAQVARVLDAELIVLATISSLAAVGGSGLLWHGERLYWSDLRVHEATPHGIRCAGYSFGGEVQEFTVDPHTGARIQDA